jgi:hypothetical protein
MPWKMLLTIHSPVEKARFGSVSAMWLQLVVGFTGRGLFDFGFRAEKANDAIDQ